MSILKSFNWSSFLPDLIIALISATIPLFIQYIITIKPLRKENSQLSKKLEQYSNNLIDDYIAIAKEEQSILLDQLNHAKSEYKRMQEYDLENGFSSQIQYLEFHQDMERLDDEIKGLIEKLKKNRSDTLKFIS